jgi:hypothetical protein
VDGQGVATVVELETSKATIAESYVMQFNLPLCATPLISSVLCFLHVYSLKFCAYSLFTHVRYQSHLLFLVLVNFSGARGSVVG